MFCDESRLTPEQYKKKWGINMIPAHVTFPKVGLPECPRPPGTVMVNIKKPMMDCCKWKNETQPAALPEIKIEVKEGKRDVVIKEQKETKQEQTDDWEWIPSIGSHVISCPWCLGKITVQKEAVNCGIFRHAEFVDGSPVPPHTSKAQMDMFLSTKCVKGCGQPFKMEISMDTLKPVVTKCDWV